MGNVIYNPKVWSELSYRDKAAYSTAYGSFILGWAIAFTGLFLPPLGDINPAVVTMAGTGLVFTGSVLGLNIWVKGTKSELMNDLSERMQKQMEEYYNNGSKQ